MRLLPEAIAAILKVMKSHSVAGPFWFWLILLAFVATAVTPTTLFACPGCKDALAAANNAQKTPFDADPATTAEMFSWTVLLMLGTVAGVFAGFAGSFYWMVRRAAAARQPAQAVSRESQAGQACSTSTVELGSSPAPMTTA